MKARRNNYNGQRVTIMGLGLNGGGLASARFFAERGAQVTVTDMKGEELLKPSIEALQSYSIRYVLGRHEDEDFSGADIVIKNPAVRPDNRFLTLAKRVETDMSIFLSCVPCPVIAVTGSKGKSTTASAIHHILTACGADSHLGGNITISPLTFLETVNEDSVVVLELSSWQLGDLKDSTCLKPKIAIITHIVPDHLDRYGTMEKYIADKRLIYKNQTKEDYTVCEYDDWGLSFAGETGGQPVLFGTARHPSLPSAVLGDEETGRLFLRDGEFPLLPKELAVAGRHNRLNLLAAAPAAKLYGLDAGAISKAAASFPGVEHRMEKFAVANEVEWFNDSAATVPQAVAAAVETLSGKHVVLITGGTDKELDFEPLLDDYAKADCRILLAGSGSDKLIALFGKRGLSYQGPYGSIEEAIEAAIAAAKPGSAVVLSPGCTSFGMFKNEFDRGLRFKVAVKARLGLSINS